MPVAGSRAAAFRLRAVYAFADTPYFVRPIVGGFWRRWGFSKGELRGALGARSLSVLSAPSGVIL